MGALLTAAIGSIFAYRLLGVQSQNQIVELTWWTAFGSGAGGFLGAIALFGLRWFLDVFKSQPVPIRRYMAVTKLNYGQDGEQNGELMHHYGQLASDPDKKDKKVWEWTRNRAGNMDHPAASAIIFGPYSNDCDEPGVYIARFRIRGLGFGRSEEVDIDWNVVVLDVAQNYTLLKDGKMVPLNNQVARTLVAFSSLAREGWHDYDVRFYSDARGTWE